VFLHEDFELAAIALVTPVGHFIANAEEEGASAEIEPADEHAAEVAEVGDVVAAGAEGAEELDGGHDGHEDAHGDGDEEE